MEYLLASVFLPLFPLSAVFNALFARVDNVWLRMVLMVAWPAAGICIVILSGGNPPLWIVYWAAFTALLYAFRSLVIRDLNRWTAYVATSVWSLLWLVYMPQIKAHSPGLAAIVLGAPLVLLPWISGRIEERFGGAYAGAVSGLSTNVPRLSSLLVFIILAVIATPVFPGFFVLLGMAGKILPVMPQVVPGILLAWLLWTWSGIRILQGLIVGPSNEEHKADIAASRLFIVLLPIIAYVTAGLALSGSLL